MKKIFLLALLVTSLITCKKDSEAPGPGASELSLSLEQAEAYPYSVVVITANKNIQAFGEKVNVGGIETSAALLEEKYIGFMVQPEMLAGPNKVKLQVNGKEYVLDLQIKALPEIADPKQVIMDYTSEMQNYTAKTHDAIDKFYVKLNIAKNETIDRLETALTEAADSLQKYTDMFNFLPADQQEIAAKIVAANHLALQEVFVSMNEMNEFIASGGTAKKNGNGCVLTSEFVQRMECFLQVSHRNTKILLLRLITHGAIGAAAGGTIGLIGGPAGAVIGAKIGLGLAVALNLRSIYNYGMVLVSNFDAAFQLESLYESLFKDVPVFMNNQATPVKIKLSRKNLQPSDAGSAVPFVKDYVGSTFDFFTRISSSIGGPPVYPLPVTKEMKPQKLSEVNITILGNTLVQFKGISGTVDMPNLKFSSTEIADQNFKFKMAYNDGVFQKEVIFDAVLKTELKMTLENQVLDVKPHQITFEVIAPEDVSWTISENADWIFVTSPSGKGNATCQLNVQQQLDTGSRTADITFKSGDITQVITVKQSGFIKTEVEIGSQIWTVRNLDVSTYRNGDIIPEVKDATQWSKLTTGAWCYYQNQTANGLIYGKLYNWYAVNDSRGLAPPGWHIPSDDEWAEMIDYLGGQDIAGPKLREAGSAHWQSPTGTNETGFTALPGGYRYGVFDDINIYAGFWTSTQWNADNAWMWDVGTYKYRNSNHKRVGLSVRCIKD